LEYDQTQFKIITEKSEGQLLKPADQETDLRTDSLYHLQESETRYRDLVDFSTSIVLEWDTEGKIVYLNKHGLDFFGYTPGELYGQHVVGTIVDPVDSEGTDLEEKMRIVPKSPDGFYSSENENVKKNGEKAWIAWTNFLYICIIDD
jgi:PAS domain S-box-containing protein